jgi:chromosome segregation ATPase
VEPGNLEERVAALETQVHQLDERVRASEQDAAAARVLAGAADRDVTEFQSELRDFRQATIASFNALREDMNDRFNRVDQRFSQVDERFSQVAQEFARVDDGFIEIRGKLDAAAAGQQHIVGLLEGLTGDQGEDGPA